MILFEIAPYGACGAEIEGETGPTRLPGRSNLLLKLYRYGTCAACAHHTNDTMNDLIAGKTSLRLSLVLCVVLPLGLVLGAAGWAGLTMVEREVEKRMENDVELVARALQQPLSRALDRERFGTVDNALAAAFNIDRVYNAQVYDSGGEVISVVGRRALEVDKDRLSELAEDQDEVGEYEEIDGQPVYSYFVPLAQPGERTQGLLHVTRNAGDMEATLARLRWAGAGLLGVAFLVMVGLVLVGHHGAIGRHLNRLSGSMSRVEAGDRSHRAPVRGPREISALGRSLNNMLDSMARAEQEARERRVAQLALEQQLKHTEKLAAIGQLSGGVAHELGSPMSVIQGKAQRALREDDVPEHVAGAFRDIQGEVERMEHIVRQLLDFGRRHTLQRRPTSPAQLAHMATDSLRRESQRAGVSMEVDVSTELDDVSVDPTLMERALSNLVRNAIEATPGGHVRLSCVEEDDDLLIFCVDDDGPGIDEDLKGRILEPFFSTKATGEGTGLGLAVVHGVVQEHGARLAVEDSPLGGARFRIVLPREEEEEPSDNGTVAPAAEPGLNGERVSERT